MIDPTECDLMLRCASGFPGKSEQIAPAALGFAFFVDDHAEGCIGCVGLLIAAHRVLFGSMSVGVHSFGDIPWADYHQLSALGQMRVMVVMAKNSITMIHIKNWFWLRRLWAQCGVLNSGLIFL